MTAEFFLSRFTPSMMSADVLEKVFVQRGDMANRIVEVLRESILTPSKHHTLVIGSRGIGKTHLLSLIQNRIASQEDLETQVRIAWLREEEWGVASFLDFLYRILRALAARYGDDELREQTEQLFSISIKTAERRAADLLRAFVEDKTLVLIAENLDSIFAGLGKKGQQRLRAYLQEESSWTILASSQALFGGVTLYESPFYGFFDIHHLQELTVDDAARLVRNIAELANDTDLAAYVQSESGRARIRAVHHLAGGNHRVYMILSEFLTRDSLDQLVEPFLRMMDDLTPYYQARMEQLSPQQRKIIDLLCSVRGAVPVKEIAKRCFISSQTASSQLKDLRDRGYVASTPVGRDTYYEMSEPLMRLALEVKNQRNGHVRLFLDFLRSWYARPELVNLLARIPAESVLEREYLQSVLAEEDELSEHPHVLRLFAASGQAVGTQERERALDVAEKLVQQRGGVADWTMLGICFLTSNCYVEALAVAERALELDHTFAPASAVRTVALVNLDRIEEAEDSIASVATLHPANAGVQWIQAEVLRKLEKYDEALAAYDRTLELSPDLVFAWVQKSEMLRVLDRHEDALSTLIHALSFHPQSRDLNINYSLLLCTLGRFSEACDAVQRIVAVQGSDPMILKVHALALAGLGKLEPALVNAMQASALDPADLFSHSMAARFSVQLERYDPALQILDTEQWRGSNEPELLELRVHTLLALDRLRDANASLEKWLTSGVSEAQMFNLARDLLASAFQITDFNRRKQRALVVYKSFQLHGFDGPLAAGLVTTAERFFASDALSSSQEWVSMWRDVQNSDETVGLAVRLLQSLLNYRETEDPRVLLKLPLEERRIAKRVIKVARQHLASKSESSREKAEPVGTSTGLGKRSRRTRDDT
jgi:tetratricopeptide (TPR) repeat protein